MSSSKASHLWLKISRLIRNPSLETLDELRASAEFEFFKAAAVDESVVENIVSAQREEPEQEIGELKGEADRVESEIVELVGVVVFPDEDVPPLLGGGWQKNLEACAGPWRDPIDPALRDP